MILQLPENMVVSEDEGFGDVVYRFRDRAIREWCSEQFDYPIDIDARYFSNPNGRLSGTLLVAKFRTDADSIHFKMRWM